MDANLFNFIQCFFTVFISAILFTAFILTNKFFNNSILKHFIAITILTVLLAIADSIQAYYETFSDLNYPVWIRMLSASCGYSLRVGVLYSLLLLFMRNYQKNYKIFMSIPAIINAVISFLALTGWKAVFYYTEENLIVRGPLIVFPFAISIFYFAVVIYMVIVNRTVGGINREAIMLAFLFLFAIIATLLEFKGRFVGLLSTYSMVGINFYYMFFLSFNYSIDQLTGAYVRVKLYEDIKNIKKDYGIIELDVNGLKILNDTKGHGAGDKCLQSVVKATRNCIPLNAEIYRIGGDEFIIIYKTEDETKVLTLVARIKSAIVRTGYSAAVGHSMKRMDEEYEKAESRADENMYIDKSLYKNAKKA